ncbi:MAG: GxxExxY protein [Luteolibacter sp.]
MNGINADGREEIHVLETERIIGCAFSVLNSVGHGFHEKVYENALVVEFKHQDIHFLQQARFPVHHRETKVGEFIPDLIVFGQVVVDTKIIPRITDHEIGQMLNYLRVTGLHVGLILNFKYSKLEFRRVTLSPKPLSK